jgi:hypothetical protein
MIVSAHHLSRSFNIIAQLASVLPHAKMFVPISPPSKDNQAEIKPIESHIMCINVAFRPFTIA